MNPITGKEIHIEPGTVMEIKEFCKITSSNYYNVVQPNSSICSNYIIKFPDEYKDIAKQFPELWINKYNECLLFQNYDSRLYGTSYFYNAKNQRKYDPHLPLGVYTLPQYMLAMCFAEVWYHTINNGQINYYSGINNAISCMHYPVEYNKKFNNKYESAMIPNVQTKACTTHWYINNDSSYDDLVFWKLIQQFISQSSFLCGDKIITYGNTKYYDNVNPVVTNVYNNAIGNEFCTALGNNEMLVINDDTQDHIFMC